MAGTSTQHAPSESRTLLQSLLDDRLLLGAFAVCGLLFAYQLIVTLLQPPWIKPTTDWLRAVLAWPQALAAAYVTVRLLRRYGLGVLAWCFGILGMLSYAVARTMWTIADIYVDPVGVPFPSLPDLFFMLQYPFWLAALVVAAEMGPWLPRLRVTIDAVLWMSAITAVLWYFVLYPIAGARSEAEAGKRISIYYQVADLVLIYGFALALTRPRRSIPEHLFLIMMCLAFTSLFIGDIWASIVLAIPPHVYRTGSPPDLFWFTFYLLVPLACLVRLRVMPATDRAPPAMPAPPADAHRARASLQFALPTLAVVAVSVLILGHATLTQPSRSDLLIPALVSFGLLVVAAIRPAVLYLEHQRLRDEREAARTQAEVLLETNRQMQEFLEMASHELNTPLTILQGNIELLGLRVDRLVRSPPGNLEEYTRAGERLQQVVGSCEQGLVRINYLVTQILEMSRIRQGRLQLRLTTCDLTQVVGTAVGDQEKLTPTRSIRWPIGAPPIAVVADASRIAQVVLHYLGNALKFSREDTVVEVRLESVGDIVRVCVRDEGIGIPMDEQAHIWDLFHKATKTPVQSGSQVGMGVGLYLCKAIVEQHHGTVGVRSTPGQGTTIWFTLPLVPPPAALSPDEGAHRSTLGSMPEERKQEKERRDT